MGPMKIDCHVHLYCGSKESGGYSRPDWIRRIGTKIQSRRLGIRGVKSEADRERLYIERLAEYVAGSELDQVVLLAFDEIYQKDGSLDETRCRFFVPNDFTHSVCAKRPDRFLFGASVHPYRRDALDELDRVKSMGAVLVKLLPNSHGFDPADPSLLPYYEKLRALELPLLVHGGFEHTIPALDQSFGDPLRLRPALETGCKVIVAHAGSAGRFHRQETIGGFLKLLDAYPNCFGDTAALTNVWRTQYLKPLLCPELLEKKYKVKIESPFSRLVHGSDFPVPIIALAFGFKQARLARSRLGDSRNALQLDIELKRARGVPDECLTLAYRGLGIGRRSVGR
jgi:predicted TIM-barrel fold metal-dependent hydrolase